MIDAFGAVTAIDRNVAVAIRTASDADPVTPLREAWIVVVPDPTASAKPEVLIVATAVLEDLQLTCVVRLPVLPLA